VISKVIWSVLKLIQVDPSLRLIFKLLSGLYFDFLGCVFVVVWLSQSVVACYPLLLIFSSSLNLHIQVHDSRSHGCSFT